MQAARRALRGLALFTLIVVPATGCGDDGDALVAGRYTIVGSISVGDGCALGLPTAAALEGAAVDVSWDGGTLRTKATTDAGDDPGQWFAFEFGRAEDETDGHIVYEDKLTGTSSYGSTPGCLADTTQNRFVAVINDEEFHFDAFVEFDPVDQSACGTDGLCQTNYEARFIKE